MLGTSRDRMFSCSVGRNLFTQQMQIITIEQRFNCRSYSLHVWLHVGQVV